MLFNLGHQQFLVFGATIWPQDLTLFAWLLISLVTGLTFVAYLQDVTRLVPDVLTLKASGSVLFWVSFFTIIT